MNTSKYRLAASAVAADDQPLTVVRRDLSGGVNTRQSDQLITETQSTVLNNVDLDTPGERSIRPGMTLIEDLGSAPGKGLYGFTPAGGTNELMAVEDTNLRGYTGSGSFTTHKNDLTSGLDTTMLRAGCAGQDDVLIVSNGTDNVHMMLQDHTMVDLGSSASDPVKTPCYLYWGNRLWALKNNKLYFSDAFPEYDGATKFGYKGAFDTATGYFNMTVGTEKALLGLRDIGIFALGADAVWGLLPSSTPVATDVPDKYLDIGCVNGNTACQVGDDIFFLAKDGVRSVRRNIQDKVQVTESFPLSYALKDEFADINWAYISGASAVYWDNKYFISLPTGSSTYNNQVWVFYPALNGWVVITGWNISRLATCSFNGEERLYGIDAVDGKVYRLWYGTSDNGTAIEFQEEGRGEDFGQPLKYKAGGEIKFKVLGGNGTLVISAAIDGNGYSQLGTISLALTGVSFPIIFPVTFSNITEQSETFPIDSLGQFKKINVKAYCDDLDAGITILESAIITFLNEYSPR